MYVEDMKTFRIIHYKVLENPVKFYDAVSFINAFIITLSGTVDIKDVILVFLKTSPFSNLGFLKYLCATEIISSYYKRSEALELYRAHKVAIKSLIINNPENPENVIKVWNDLNPSQLYRITTITKKQ